jgi:hypothetical protein
MAQDVEVVAIAGPNELPPYLGAKRNDAVVGARPGGAAERAAKAFLIPLIGGQRRAGVAFVDVGRDAMEEREERLAGDSERSRQEPR